MSIVVEEASEWLEQEPATDWGEHEWRLFNVIVEYESLLASVEGKVWQPMETAPRDGTEVLVAYYGEVYTAKYIESNVSNDYPFFATTVNGDPWNCSGVDYRIKYEYLKPTHWMPLPEPPKVTND